MIYGHGEIEEEERKRLVVLHVAGGHSTAAWVARELGGALCVSTERERGCEEKGEGRSEEEKWAGVLGLGLFIGQIQRLR